MAVHGSVEITGGEWRGGLEVGAAAVAVLVHWVHSDTLLFKFVLIIARRECIIIV